MTSVLLAAIALLATGVIAEESTGLGLDETVLDLADPPFRVDDVLTDGQLSSLRCTESANGVLVCPVQRYGDRMFGVMIDRSGSQNRVTTALVFWSCEVDTCVHALEQTVASYVAKLGEEPELLNGTPIWKDREASSRDLMVTKMGENMIAVMLLRSDP